MTLQAIQDKFRLLFEHSSDAHCILDDTGITDCNDAMVQLLKAKSKDEVLRVHPARLSPAYQPDGRLSLEKSMEMDELARQKGFHRFEWMHQKLNGEVFPVEVTLNAVTINGKPSIIAVWHDLTERKKNEQKLLEAHEKMKADLESAAAIQKSLLPFKSPLIRGLRVAWSYEPSQELGGDILNIFLLDEKHVGFYVLDVTGHGIAASLLSVAASHFLSPFSESSFIRKADGGIACPTEVARRLSQQFGSYSEATQFFTMVYGILDLDNFECRYVCAGHPAPAIASGKTARIIEGGDLPVGILSDAEYTPRKIKLERGDRLCLYSDGIIEAKNSGTDMLGEESFLKILTSASHKPVNEVADDVILNVREWCAPERPQDDISLLILEVKR